MNSWAWASHCILVDIRAKVAESIINKWARDTASGIGRTNTGSLVATDSAASDTAWPRKIVSSGTAKGNWCGTASDPVELYICAI